MYIICAFFIKDLFAFLQGASVTYTFQAMSEFERKHWVESLGGTWPAISTLQKLRADSVEDNLNSMAFTFLKDCLQELESRGLNDQGLYRVGGVVSKVKKLLNEGLIGMHHHFLPDSEKIYGATPFPHLRDVIFFSAPHCLTFIHSNVHFDFLDRLFFSSRSFTRLYSIANYSKTRSQKFKEKVIM